MKYLFKLISLSFTMTQTVFAVVPKDPLAAKVQEINIGAGSEPQTLDPTKCNETVCSDIIDKLFEGLVRSDENGEIRPSQAEKWSMSPDGKVYTFYLRKNLKWSDGSKVTAYDYVYSLQRLADPKVASEQSSFLENVLNGKEITAGQKSVDTLGVKALSDNILEVVLSKPTPYFLEIMSVLNTYPVQKKNLEKYGSEEFNHAGKLVSNGAFKLLYRRNGDKIILEPNEHYWNKENIYLDKVNFIITNDLNSEYRMYESGQLHKTYEIPADRYKEIQAKYSKEFNNKPYLSNYFYIFNLNNPKFKDKKLRTALNIAIDREIITKTILGLGQKPLYDLIPYGMKNYAQNKAYWQDWPREKQLLEAKKLFKEAGYSDGKSLKIQILYNTSENHKKVAVAIASMWKQAFGIVAEPVNEEWKTMLDTRELGKFEVMRMGGVANLNDPYDFLIDFTSKSNTNSSKFKNVEFDKYFEMSKNELNPSKRQKMQEQLGRIIIEEVPVMPIYSGTMSFLLKENVKGLKVDVKRKFSLTGVYLTEKAKNLN
ncbi:peptide ABC transporter substrate-binding protein [Fluviispira multicolorata]|uniref:Peptide ABC transporter substrate-binding protein n=1 Tax=Fluviispira multicolorata TaxID=2654512 RepID=A0A833JE29_9BACT|nr:peptide ABC transporter substrate-binding protein [Fluviispira multicolorata]KAB8032193.1 peptide ABC transporter substrate-binding protein [Fluviispira multicolorata]